MSSRQYARQLTARQACNRPPPLFFNGAFGGRLMAKHASPSESPAIGARHHRRPRRFVDSAGGFCRHVTRQARMPRPAQCRGIVAAAPLARGRPAYVVISSCVVAISDKWRSWHVVGIEMRSRRAWRARSAARKSSSNGRLTASNVTCHAIAKWHHERLAAIDDLAINAAK